MKRSKLTWLGWIAAVLFLLIVVRIVVLDYLPPEITEERIERCAEYSAAGQSYETMEAYGRMLQDTYGREKDKEMIRMVYGEDVLHMRNKYEECLLWEE